jgi:hypothetical protein
MSARHVAGLVRDYTNELAGPVERLDEPGVDEEILAPCDKSVELFVLDEKYLNRIGVEARRLENWLGITANDMFDLCVADQRLRVSGARAGGEQGRRDE